MEDHAMVAYKKRMVAVLGTSPRTRVPNERRAQFERYTAVFQEPFPPGLTVLNWFVAAPGREIPIRVYRPDSGTAPRPTIIYMHGGGYMSGSLYSHDTVIANLAMGTGAQVISMHYRRAPENPYPAAVDDVYFILEWAVREAKTWEIDPDRLAVAGDSCGGGLTAAISMMARDRRGPKLKMQILLYPGPMNTDLSGESFTANNSDPHFNTSDIRFYLDAYLAGKLDTKDPYAVPLVATDYANLPPAFIHPAELDPLLDDGTLYHQRILAAGGKSTLRIAKRLHHSFLRAVTVSPEAAEEARVLYAAICDGLGIAPAKAA